VLASVLPVRQHGQVSPDEEATKPGGQVPPAALVLLPPLDQGCDHFDGVLAALPEHGTVVRAERPRPAASAARPGWAPVRTLVDDLSDLEDLLLGQPGDVLLLGASYGGLLARAFAGRHRDVVRGVVLVDAVHEDVYARMREIVGDEADTVIANAEGLDLVRAVDQARTLLRGHDDLGDTPVVALARDGLRPDEHAVHPRVADLDRVWREQQELLATCSTRCRLDVVPGAGHLICSERPDVVAAAVREVAA
jgi:pimeloyl-ACP methyl ester carboxylesterase